jgi:hypothetical protein
LEIHAERLWRQTITARRANSRRLILPVELTLYGEPVATVFDLLGDKENDITYSVGWALAESEQFASALLEDVVPGAGSTTIDLVRLQEGMSGAGFTDIEIEAERAKKRLHLVIEAKRGYALPSAKQLTKYATRSEPPPTALLVCAEASRDFVQGKLPEKAAGVQVYYRSWGDLEQLVVEAASRSRRHVERRLLRDLSCYLRGLMTMQNVSSNLVYVVSLGGEIEDTGITFRDVVLKHDTYFCPIGGNRGGWPKEPPNYLGFRFDGKLQQVRHVEDYQVVEDDHAGFEPLKGKVDWSHERHWMFTLGPPIVPAKDVATGKLWPSHRGWIAIDLLLTCKTVAEARDKTNARLEAAGGTH